MNIQINSSIFNDFIKKSKIVSSDTIIVDATGIVELIKFDAQNQISTIIDADIIERGVVKIPKEVFPLIKNNEIMRITNERITIGNREINLNLEDVQGYPKIMDDFKYNVFDLSDKELKLLLEVEHAISTDLTKPILTGIRIEDNRFTTIDGYRLSERTGNFKSDVPITISNHKMLKALKGNIKATCSDKYIKYQVDDYTYYNRLLNGEFISSDKLKPKEYRTEVIIERNRLLETLKSIKNLTAKVKNQLVKFSIRDNVMYVIATNKTDNKKKKDTVTQELSVELKDSISCEVSGDYLDIAFNCNYLIDSLSKMDKQVNMRFTTNVNPIVITSYGKYELVLPVRIASSI